MLRRAQQHGVAVGHSRRAFLFSALAIVAWAAGPSTASADRIEIRSLGVPTPVTCFLDSYIYKNDGFTDVIRSGVQPNCNGQGLAILYFVGGTIMSEVSGLGDREVARSEGEMFNNVARQAEYLLGFHPENIYRGNGNITVFAQGYKQSQGFWTYSSRPNSCVFYQAGNSAAAWCHSLNDTL